MFTSPEATYRGSLTKPLRCSAGGKASNAPTERALADKLSLVARTASATAKAETEKRFAQHLARKVPIKTVI